MNFEPKVFGNGDVTIAVSQDGFVFYVGQKRISHIKNFSVRKEEGKPVVVEVCFNKQTSQWSGQEIEENVRVASTFPWIRVIP